VTPAHTPIEAELSVSLERVGAPLLSTVRGGLGVEQVQEARLELHQRCLAAAGVRAVWAGIQPGPAGREMAALAGGAVGGIPAVARGWERAIAARTLACCIRGKGSFPV
jgi:hypothetical protein